MKLIEWEVSEDSYQEQTSFICQLRYKRCLKVQDK
jgi:hypothetical protein